MEQLFAAGVFAYFLIFCRVGSTIMLLPGIGEAYVPPRVRLVFALLVSAVLAPVLLANLPAEPRTIGNLMAMAGGEILIGIFMGMVARILISAMNTAGTIIALQSGLASALVLDITQTTQTAVLTNLLSVTAVTLLFATDLHHVILNGIHDSYAVFPAGHFPIIGDITYYLTATVTHAFSIGARIAAPQIVVGIILYLGAGVLARLMPTMQIFFILMPPQILLSFFVLMVTLSGTMLWYMSRLHDSLINFPGLP